MDWKRFTQHLFSSSREGFSLDISGMAFSDHFPEKNEAMVQMAFAAMDSLEKGAIANPDENRMVGHYWLRKPDLAPTPEIGREIRQTVDRIESFAAGVHAGSPAGGGGKFQHVLVIGIGGSALGPQFVSQALAHPRVDRARLYFFDNTDPDGMDQVLASLEGKLDRTLAIVISKSGSTPETRNGMVEARHAWESAGLDFSRHAVAITGEGSRLDEQARREKWLARFPMWDWVGGRTSELAAVGLLPAALQGIPIREMLAGAAKMDEWTRRHETSRNPAALLALMWLHATKGRGEKDMVILPYKDRLALFSKYLQQLIMESLGKERDLDGRLVNQGIAVYGNKGSTDQHAYVQQLREGINNFFVTFIEVLNDRGGDSPSVEGAFTSGDFLHGFFLGTRAALRSNGRESITITLREVSPRTVGMLIALYERAVGFYASFVNVNAYHQPGVEAGKKAAAEVLSLKDKITRSLAENGGKPMGAEQLAEKCEAADSIETVYKLLEHMAANPRTGVIKESGEGPPDSLYRHSPP